MSVDSIIATAMKEVPKALACGVVDMEMGMLLGVKTIDSHPSEVLDLVAAATKDLFEGDNVIAIENTFKKARGVSNNDRYFQEFLVTSANLLHYFGRLSSNSRVVIVIVCAKDANLGMVMTKSRSIATSETV